MCACVHVSIIFYCVCLRERVVEEHQRTGELLVELGSDQTSLHNPYGGGYYPVQLSFDEAQSVIKEDLLKFKHLVQERYTYNIKTTLQYYSLMEVDCLGHHNSLCSTQMLLPTELLRQLSWLGPNHTCIAPHTKLYELKMRSVKSCPLY